MKKLLSVLLCAVMVLSLAACGKKDDAPIDDAGNGGDADGLTVALVVAGKLGDRSFYDSSKEGLDRMVADLGVTPIVIECNNENHDIQMKNAAEKANIVVCVGWEFYNVETIAPDYPEVNWIWVDNATSAPVSNVLNITYAQNEGSFLAGYIAAAVSKSGVVGAVGGEDADTINDFIVGYTQGAEYYGTENGKEISVVLPAPFSPTRAKTSPFRMSSDTSSLASTPGNSMEIWRNSTAFSCKARYLTFFGIEEAARLLPRRKESA